MCNFLIKLYLIESVLCKVIYFILLYEILKITL
jgi:hypothetical protein